MIPHIVEEGAFKFTDHPHIWQYKARNGMKQPESENPGVLATLRKATFKKDRHGKNRFLQYFEEDKDEENFWIAAEVDKEPAPSLRFTVSKMGLLLKLATDSLVKKPKGTVCSIESIASDMTCMNTLRDVWEKAQVSVGS